MDNRFHPRPLPVLFHGPSCRKSYQQRHCLSAALLVWTVGLALLWWLFPAHTLTPTATRTATDILNGDDQKPLPREMLCRWFASNCSFSGSSAQASHKEVSRRKQVAEATTTPSRVYHFNQVPNELLTLINSSSRSDADTRQPPDWQWSDIKDDESMSYCTREDFGALLLSRWAAQSQEMCRPSAASNSLSSFTVHRIRQARHSGDDLYVKFTSAIIQPSEQVSSTPTIKLQCRPQTPLFPANHLYFKAHLGIIMLLSWMRFDDSSELAMPPRASKAFPLMQSPLATHWLFVHRDCSGRGNLYHCSADLINTFMLMKAHNLEPSRTAIVFLDDQSSSLDKFSRIWRSLAQRGLYNRNMHRIEPSIVFPANQPILVETGYIVHSSGSNLIWKDFWMADPCHKPSPLLTAYARYTSSLYLSSAIEMYSAAIATDSADRPLIIIILSRRTASYRKIENEISLLHAMRDVAPRGSSFLCIEPADLSFDDQIRMINIVDIIVAAHGAALSLLLYASPELAQKRQLSLLEIFVGEQDRPRVYENLAVHLGVLYEAHVHTGPISEGKVMVVDETLVCQKFVALLRQRLPIVQTTLQ